MEDKIERQSIVLSIDKDFAWNDNAGRLMLKVPLILGGAKQTSN
jgi:hypothetical protein